MEIKGLERENEELDFLNDLLEDKETIFKIPNWVRAIILGRTKMIEARINDYKEQEPQKIILPGWKGKSSFEVINSATYFTVITFKRDDQDSDPHEVKRDITKIEVNRIIDVIMELNKCNLKEKISTREIGEKAYKRPWDEIFADRFLHTNLNLILRILDYYGFTLYRGGQTQVLKPCEKFK